MLREILVKIKGLRDEYQDKKLEEKFNRLTVGRMSVEAAIDRAEFLGRTDSICDVLIENAKLTKSDRVLDIGCWTGIWEYLLEKRDYNNFMSIDISKDAVRIANKIKKMYKMRSIFRVGDAERLKFPDKSFDVVLLFSTLHHLPRKSMEKSLAEAKRVLKKGGRVVVTEPNLWNLKIILNHMLDKMSYNEFPYSYPNMVGEVGRHFRIEKVFTRRFVPRTEKADAVLQKIPIINKLGSQTFIVGRRD